MICVDMLQQKCLTGVNFVGVQPKEKIMGPNNQEPNTEAIQEPNTIGFQEPNTLDFQEPNTVDGSQEPNTIDNAQEPNT